MRVFRVKPGHARPIRAWEGHRSPRRQSGDTASERIRSSMLYGLAAGPAWPVINAGLAQWAGVPSLALRAFIGGDVQPEPTPGRRRRRESIPVAGAPGFDGG